MMVRLPGGRSQRAWHAIRIFEQERYGRAQVASDDVRAATDTIDEVRRGLEGDAPVQ
jgi:hypothetical protein